MRPRVGRPSPKGRIGQARRRDPMATRTPVGTLATISSDALAEGILPRAASSRGGAEHPHEPGTRLGRLDHLVHSTELDRAVQAADRPLVLGDGYAPYDCRSS